MIVLRYAQRHQIGYGWCGCPRPDLRHDSGCLWGLDQPRPLQHRQDQGPHLDLLRPRPDCCVICGELLDRGARGANDNRCTRCYEALFTTRRRQALREAG